MEYDVDTESHISRILLGKFFKETIEIQPLEPELNVSKHFQRDIERSESSNSFESFKNSASPCHEANYMNQLKMNWLFNFFSSA